MKSETGESIVGVDACRTYIVSALEEGRSTADYWRAIVAVLALEPTHFAAQEGIVTSGERTAYMLGQRMMPDEVMIAVGKALTPRHASNS